MDRVWDTSKYHSKPFVALYQVKVIQGHEVKKISNVKVWVWVVWYVLLGQIFVKNVKKPKNTFSTAQIRHNFKFGTMLKSS